MTYITLEGVDGSGTTTVMNRLKDRIEFEATCEPTNTWLGNIVRESYEERTLTPELTRFYLFMADRVEHCERRIKPLTEDGLMVISDRGPDSTRAYQYHTSGLSSGFINFNLEKTITPDLTIWFDVDVETAMARLNNNDDFEKPELQRKVNDRYEQLYKSHERIKRVDASNPVETVTDDVERIINDTF